MNAVDSRPPTVTHGGKAITLPDITEAQWRTMVYRAMSSSFIHGVQSLGAAVAMLYLLSGLRGKGELVRLCALPDEQLEPELMTALNLLPEPEVKQVADYIAAKTTTFKFLK